MTLAELRAKWEARQIEWRRLGVQLSGESIASEVLADLAAIADDGPLVSLSEGAAQSGYSADYLGRLIRTGALTNHGTKARPRVRRSDLPRKPLRPPTESSTLSRSQTVAAVITQGL